jgi:hypothetical protein
MMVMGSASTRMPTTMVTVPMALPAAEVGNKSP